MIQVAYKFRETYLKTSFLILTFVCLLPFSLLAQDIPKNIPEKKPANAAPKFTFRGTVVDEKGNPMAKVSISVKNAKKAFLTDEKGKFVVQTEINSYIYFSFVGYTDKEVKVTNLQNQIITLEATTKLLDDVVVIGYGVRKKKEITGAVSQVKGEDLEKTSASDIGTAIQGRVAGVNVQASSGSPGEEANILIRGTSSIQGSNSPLYIVDGIPYDSDPKLSPNEIASLDILKDAASAAVYGSRGANGVIIVTTKQGKAGEMKMSLNSYYGIQKITSKLPLMNIYEFLYQQSVNQLTSGGIASKDNTFFQTQTATTLLNNNTDWLRELQVDNAVIQNHSVQLSGGTQYLQYNFSGSYFSQDGSLINSSYNRYNSRMNVIYTKNKWNIQTGLAFSTDNKKTPPNNLIYRAINLSPYLGAISNSSQQELLPIAGSAAEVVNVSQQINSFRASDIGTTDNFNGNMKITHNFTKNLSFSSTLGVVYANGRRLQTSPKFSVFQASTNTTVEGAPVSSLNYISTRSTNFLNENVLNYKLDIKKDHHFVFTGLYSIQKSTTNLFAAFRNSLVSNDLNTLDAATGTPFVSGNRSVRSIESLLGRVQYNYKSRYLLSASVRQDGSSRFAATNRFAAFPSFSAGWNVSEENFWRKINGTVNSLRFRASLGQTGSQNFADYITVPVLTTNLNYAFGRESGDNMLTGTTQTVFTNQDVKWETSITQNFGFDIAFFKNALTLTVDYYRTNKKHMLFPVLVPLSAGTGNSTVTKNVGDLANNGIEISATYKYQRRDFRMSVTANISANKNVATYVPTTLYLSSGAPVAITGVNDFVTVVKQGYEVGAFFLIPTSGIIKTPTQLASYISATGKTGARIGDLIYQDINKDGRISDDDRVYMGSGIPLYDAGLNFTFNFKSIELSMLWYASVGNEAINGGKIYAYQQATHKDLIYQYSGANTASNIPTYRGNTSDNLRAFSDYWIEDASFIRLREITLGYNFQPRITRKLRLNLFKVFVSGQNILTLTKYQGFDPEVGGDGVGSRGIDKATYPISSQYKAGLQINF